jgi:hypothetical protein
VSTALASFDGMSSLRNICMYIYSHSILARAELLPVISYCMGIESPPIISAKDRINVLWPLGQITVNAIIIYISCNIAI